MPFLARKDDNQMWCADSDFTVDLIAKIGRVSLPLAEDLTLVVSGLRAKPAVWLYLPISIEAPDAIVRLTWKRSRRHRYLRVISALAWPSYLCTDVVDRPDGHLARNAISS